MLSFSIIVFMKSYAFFFFISFNVLLCFVKILNFMFVANDLLIGYCSTLDLRDPPVSVPGIC